MTTFDRCLESLSFCHQQDEHLWAAARIVAQQDIDEFIREQGPDLTDKLRELSHLMAEFEARFPDQTDPVLIRSQMRRHIRRIQYDLKQADRRPAEQGEPPPEEAPATIPEMDSEGDLAAQQADVEHEPGAGVRATNDTN
jgi:hypothetical protein